MAALILYISAVGLFSSVACAWYAIRIARLKTTRDTEWYLMAAGFASSFLFELFKLMLFESRLLLIHGYSTWELITSQGLQTAKFLLPMIALGLIYETRKRYES